jgi:hypothetical protein
MIDIQESIISLLLPTKVGFTWKELQRELRDTFGERAHHGTISGALSTLHKKGVVFSLKSKRNNCKPYVHHSFRESYKKDERNDYPKSSKWESMADVLYHAMTSDNIAPTAWEDALNSYRTLKQNG